MDVIFNAIGYGNFILVIFLIVLVHEFGHYAVARMCGVRVLVFSVGFGRELIGWTDKHGTRWKISLLPLGGYVKMQDEPSPSQPSPQPSPSTSENASRGEGGEGGAGFSSKALWQKTLIVAAGPAANYIYAVLMLAMIFTFIGQPQTADYQTSGIGAVVPDTPAAKAQLQKGDIITHVNHQPIDSFDKLAEIITTQAPRNDSLSIEVLRGQEKFALNIRPQTIEQNGRTYYRLGIARPSPKYVPQNIITSMGLSVSSAVNWTGLILHSLAGMVTGSVSLDELGGPVRIAQISKDAGSNGAYSFLFLTVILSVNLGLINLLPLPLTDGMHLALYALQAVRRRPISAKTQDMIMRFGFVFIVGLMLFIVLNDIRQIAF